MDFIKPILSISSSIYKLVEKVKANKKRCCRLAERIKALEVQVKLVQTRQAVLKSSEAEEALRGLQITLTSARDLIEIYTHSNWFLRILKSGIYMDDFTTVNERLNDAFMVLFGLLRMEDSHTLYRVFELSNRREQDEKDRQDDKRELKSYFDALQGDMTNMMALLTKPSATDVTTRMITAGELNIPQAPFMVTSSSEFYKGEYHGFTVAVKRFTDPEDASFSEISSVFNKEVETMKRFESPNILRMFGICVIDADGPKPEYLIVMEYCERGSLREVLDSECELAWIRKARMCLDAAQALYRLHQTEDKSKVHGCITSSRFLVDESYRLKLGGFELAQTESSLKKGKKVKQTRSLFYSSPQMLSSIDCPYSKECEVYSLGIVMWEIATRRHPFADPVSNVKWESGEIIQRVGKDGYMEPLPGDCPEALGQLINACRAFESFKRPSAGVLMDKLRSVVAQMEEL